MATQFECLRCGHVCIVATVPARCPRCGHGDGLTQEVVAIQDEATPRDRPAANKPE